MLDFIQENVMVSIVLFVLFCVVTGIFYGNYVKACCDDIKENSEQ